MEGLAKQIKQLAAEIHSATARIGLDTLTDQIKDHQKQSQQAGFWDNNQKARDTMKNLASLEERSAPWQALTKAVSELEELAALNDPALEHDLKKQLEKLEADFASLKAQLKLSGPYDDHNTILSIHAGAGGTDAQDWAAMLLRMYTRWAEKNSFKPQLIDQSSGDEAGLKSATLEVSGPFAYGKLKGEHGVHRLVRLSPFNADNLRQTSFAKVEVVPKIERPEELAIDEKDLKVDVYRAGGHGGQSVNTTDSAVRITHLPTGVVVAIQNERSQLQNKETALTLLRSKLTALKLEQHREKVEELKGPNLSAEWGNQIRSYVLHPYKQVKDLRTRYETADAAGVLDGNLEPFIDAYLEHSMKSP